MMSKEFQARTNAASDMQPIDTTSSHNNAKPNVIRCFYFYLVKLILLKPLVKLSYVVNGKMFSEPKWYERTFKTPVRSKWLNSITYRLTKYVMFR